MALPAAFPLAVAGDDFNRADEGPPPGASWSSPIYSGQSGLTVASNELAGAAAWKDAYITDAVGPDLDVIFTLSTLPAGANNIYLHVRLDPTRLGNDASGYALQLQPGGTYGLNIVRYLTGTPTTVYTGTPVAVTAGTKLGIRIHGQRIDIYRQPPAGAWTLIGGVNDPTWTGATSAGTRIGMEWNDATMRVDDFQWISLGSGESASSPPLGNHPMQSSLLRSTMQLSGAQPNAATIWSDWVFGTVSGVTEHFGATASTYTFAKVVAGFATKATSSASTWTFTKAVAGVRVRFGATASTWAFGATTSGSRAVFGASASTWTFTATTAGRRVRLGASASTWAFGATTVGRVGKFGATATGITFTATTAGRRVRLGVVSMPIAFNATTAGFVTPASTTHFGATASTWAFGATTEGILTALGIVARPLTFAATTAGARTAFGAVDMPITFTALSSGTSGAPAPPRRRLTRVDIRRTARRS